MNAGCKRLRRCAAKLPRWHTARQCGTVGRCGSQKPNIALGALGCGLSAAMAMPACAADDVIADRSFASENAYRLASGTAIAKAVPVIINALFAK